MKKKEKILKHITIKIRGGVKPTRVQPVKTKYTRKIKHKENLTNEQGVNYERTVKKKP